MNQKKKRFCHTAVDLYSGSGSVTAGLKKNQFRVIAAVDFDPIACATYKINHPSTTLFQSDIKNVDPKLICKLLPKNRNLDLLVVCAPCQPFSSQNRYKKSTDKRRNLILESIRFIRILNPKIIMFENVPGFASEKFEKILEELSHKLIDLGYRINSPMKIDASDFGVPQRRERCILFAARKDLPKISSSNILKTHVRDAFKGLKSLKSGETDTSDLLHFARKHKPIALERLSYIPKNGGDRFSLPFWLELDCHKGKNCYPDVYGRMRWDDVAPTLTTGCTDITKGRFAHPEDDRAISLREAARLQTFPDKYQFYGNSGQIATQIGNAVPMKLIENIAPAIRKALK